MCYLGMVYQTGYEGPKRAFLTLDIRLTSSIQKIPL